MTKHGFHEWGQCPLEVRDEMLYIFKMWVLFSIALIFQQVHQAGIESLTLQSMGHSRPTSCCETTTESPHMFNLT